MNRSKSAALATVDRIVTTLKNLDFGVVTTPSETIMFQDKSIEVGYRLSLSSRYYHRITTV